MRRANTPVHSWCSGRSAGSCAVFLASAVRQPAAGTRVRAPPQLVHRVQAARGGAKRSRTSSSWGLRPGPTYQGAGANFAAAQQAPVLGEQHPVLRGRPFREHRVVRVGIVGRVETQHSVPAGEATEVDVQQENLEAAREIVATVDDAELFLYSGDQHYVADSSLPSYDLEGTALLTRRVLDFSAGSRKPGPNAPCTSVLESRTELSPEEALRKPSEVRQWSSPNRMVIRELAHESLGWRPTTLQVTVRRYRCAGCGHIWRQDTTAAAEPPGEVVARH